MSDWLELFVFAPLAVLYLAIIITSVEEHDEVSFKDKFMLFLDVMHDHHPPERFPKMAVVRRKREK